MQRYESVDGGAYKTAERSAPYAVLVLFIEQHRHHLSYFVNADSTEGFALSHTGGTFFGAFGPNEERFAAAVKAARRMMDVLTGVEATA